jgi:serine phosphatase RsbU (regulator of sigma subunit)
MSQCLRSDLHTNSPAFRKALLRSERLRIYILLGSLLVILLSRILRTIFVWTPENRQLLLMLGVFVAVVMAYEILILRKVKRAENSSYDLRRRSWLLNIVAEACLPAFALVLLVNKTVDPAYRPLINPVFLLYFLLIILSTLRLYPWASWFSGLLAAASYLAAAWILGWRPVFGGSESLASPSNLVWTYAFSLLLAGVVAGIVAREVRKQVEAALREAESRRELERLEHDLSVAHSIQQSLLPAAMPEIDGFEIGAWNKPADETGGDYYDWQPLPDGKILIALADVTGHGIGPALLAAVCRAYTRAHFHVGTELMKTMGEINAALAGDITEGRFITFVAAVCDPNTSCVEILSAGHGPLFFYWSREDRFESVEAQGLPLGVLSTLLSEPPRILDLSPGDLVVLTTDGFFEWANSQGEFFGVQRLTQTIRANLGKPPAEIIDSLYQAVILFSGGTLQKDDLTAVVIKRRANGLALKS